MEQMNILDYIDVKVSEEKREHNKGKIMEIGISDIFTYHNRKYICLGAKSDEKWKASKIVAVKLKDFQKNSGVIDKDIMMSISLEELKDRYTFKLPMSSMPGNCIAYWLDLKSMEYVVMRRSGENVLEVRDGTKSIKKTKYKELLSA